MTIYQRMAAIFVSAGLPGFLHAWMATDEYPEIPDTYCTYLVESETGALAADDAAAVETSVVWIDLYGQLDVSTALLALTQALLEDGFCVSYTRDLDNQRLSRHQYHRRMRVVYYDYSAWLA